MEKVADFLAKNKVSFEQLIRCYNFWSRLPSKDKEAAIEKYKIGAYSKNGHY